MLNSIYKKIFAPTRFVAEDKINRLYLFWTVLGILMLAMTLESIVDLRSDPSTLVRSITVITIIDGGGILLFLASSRGHVRLASYALIAILWGLTTYLDWAEGAVYAPTLDIAYLVIIIIAGLLINEAAGIVMGVVCSLSMYGLALASIQSGAYALVKQQNPLMIFWDDLVYVVIVVGLQYLSVSTIRGALNRAHQELVERKKIELDQIQTQAQLEVQRFLAERQEDERLKIARDLHDGPVQDLVGATFSIKCLIDDAKDPEAKRGLQDIQELLQKQIDNLRTYASELRPPTLMKFGVEQAIRSHLDEFRERHPEITIEFDCQQSGPLVPEEVRLGVFRVYQEAMNNVARHARATQATVYFRKDEHNLYLKVQDNGRGFRTPNDWTDLARQRHFGLLGMRERVDSFGGHLDISSDPERGTAVQLELSLDGIHQSAYEPAQAPPEY